MTIGVWGSLNTWNYSSSVTYTPALNKWGGLNRWAGVGNVVNSINKLSLGSLTVKDVKYCKEGALIPVTLSINGVVVWGDEKEPAT